MVLNRFLKSTNTLIYDPDMWRIQTLRAWSARRWRRGRHTPMMIVGEYSLRHKNFGASAASSRLRVRLASNPLGGGLHGPPPLLRDKHGQATETIPLRTGLDASQSWKLVSRL